MFNDVVKANAALRVAVGAAARELPTPPSNLGIDQSIVRGPNAAISAEELESWHASREAAGRRHEFLDAHDAQEKEDDSTGSEGLQVHHDLLSEPGVAMRKAWQDFWNAASAAVVLGTIVDRHAGALREAWEAWAADEKFNVRGDLHDRSVGYLVSRLLRHLHRRFPSKQDADLVRVTVEVVHLAYGEDVETRAYAAIRRLRQ